MAEEKTHKPTDRKKEKARKDGKILKSQVASQACVFSFACLILYFITEPLILSFVEISNTCWLNNTLNYHKCLNSSAWVIFYFTGMLLLVTSISGIAFEIYLIGWKPDVSHLTPKAERLNFVAGFKKIFTNWQELLQLIIKLCLFSFVSYIFFQKAYHELLLSFSLNISLIQAKFIKLLFNALFLISLTWIILAIYDYLRNYKKYFKELSMSEDEIRKEHKDSEGDPLIKAHRRNLHEELLMSDVIKRIKKANVVIVERVE